ncbi:MAG: FAD-binding protein, partial [Cytophagaceae bacterium]
MSTEDLAATDELDVVIVGAGLAGAEAAFELRERGHLGRITLIGKESFPPYSRPPLSKTYLKGEGVPDVLWIRPQSAYEQQRIELILGVQVTEVDRGGRMVHLSNGKSRHFERLILAVGGEANALKLAGADLPGVCVLKSLQDAEKLRHLLSPSAQVVVIGGGFVGMEFAATARTLGCQVVVLESQQMILSRALAPEISEHLRAEHRNRGVEILTEVAVARIEDLKGRKSVVLQDGRI